MTTSWSSRSPHALTNAVWLKSAYSGGNDNCVEVARTSTRVAVRDSKEPGLRPALTTCAAWGHFIAAMNEGSIH